MTSRRATLALCVAAALVATAMAPSGCSPSAPRTIFEDGFSGATLDPAWTPLDRQGDTGVGEQGCYQPSQVAVEAGQLVIHSAAQAATCGDRFNPPVAYPFVTGTVQWTSFAFTYGTVEIRARLAGGRGTWSTLWLLGAACRDASLASGENLGCPWPQPGSEEIDIAEIKNSDLSTVWQNLISAVSGTFSCTPATTDVSRDFHVYTLEWTPRSLVWRIDGAETCRFTGTTPASPMFLIIGTAIGGGAGPADPSTFPQTMLVDDVRITQP